jgi:hypothetical protein
VAVLAVKIASGLEPVETLAGARNIGLEGCPAGMSEEAENKRWKERTGCEPNNNTTALGTMLILVGRDRSGEVVLTRG